MKESRLATKPKSKPAPVVAVLNMKGGVGKTTISAHVMRVLYLALMKKTLLIDFDPQFNLTQTVVPQTQYEKLKQANQTILSVMEPAPVTSLFSVTESNLPPPSVADVSIQMKRTHGGTAELRLVPGDFGLVKYSLIDDTKALAPIRTRFKQFVAQAQAEMDLVCIDCNPSSSFMTICALQVATHVLVPVRPDRFSVLGLELLDKFISGLPTLKTKPKLLVLLNGIPRTNYDPTVENSLRSHPEFGSKTLVNPLYHSSILAANPSYTGFATDKPVPNRHRVSANVGALARELGKELGLTP
jgi:chromosome partitioning protein